MYCDACGTQLQPGQRFCGSCGKPAGIVAVPPPPSSRVARHLPVLAILWLVAGALNLIVAAFLLIFGNAGPFRDALAVTMARGFLQALFTGLGILVLLKALGCF